MTRPLRLDTNRAAVIASEALEKRPELRDRIASYASDGQRWRIRAVLDEDDLITLVAMVGSRAAVALWHGPRALVELPEPGRH